MDQTATCDRSDKGHGFDHGSLEAARECVTSGRFDQDPGPDQACTDGGWYCTGPCKAQDGGFIVDIRFNGQDGEASCRCEHHEAVR